MQSIKKLLTKHFIKYSLIPILIIEISLLILYFTINYYISEKTSQKMKQEYLKNGKELLGKEANRIDQMLLEVKNIATFMQKEHEQILSKPELFNVNEVPKFEFAKNGVYYKTTKSGSSVYYSSKTKITQYEKEKAILTETMDPFFKNIVDLNNNIVAAYFNAYDNMTRIYPYIDNIHELFGEHINLSDFNFYFLANKNHNPKKEAVWTEVYLDPAGRGWMFSCIVPIYKDNFLEGVSGLDITIYSLISNILETKLPYNANMFLVDRNGMILAMPKEIEKLLNISELKSHTYENPITHTITKPLQFNVFKNQNRFAKHFKNMIKNNIQTAELSANEKKYITIQHKVEETDWKLMILIDEENIFNSIEELKTFSNSIGYLAIFFMILFYMIYFYILSKKSLKLSNNITNPLKELTNQTSQVGDSNKQIDIVNTNIQEIHTLSTNFSNMSKELNERTKELIKSEIEKQEKDKEAKHYLNKSLKDPLTSLYNRGKIDQILNILFKEYKEKNTIFSVIFLDIDHFKKINDNYGHTKGDKVLIKIAEILKNITRENDFVGRYGGEEFIIVVENNLEIASMIGEKIRVAIESTQFKIDHKVTCSLGVSMIKDTDTKETLLQRADKALYEAKESGRNKIITSL